MNIGNIILGVLMIVFSIALFVGTLQHWKDRR